MSASSPAWRYIWDRISFTLRRAVSKGRQGTRPLRRLELEFLEDRNLPSVAVPSYAVFPGELARPADGPGPYGYSAAQIRTAYGINSISFNGAAGDGSGQTIAIVDAYNDPVVFSELDGFDQGNAAAGSGPTLYQQYGAASSFLTVYNQNGTVINPTTTHIAANSDWEGEEALDVEWAHAMAPGAKIALIECNSPNSLFPQGVKAAAALPGVSVVSMSFSTGDFSSESFYDTDFTTPSGHQGVTFLAATGDNGAPSGYPALSPNVVAVGGTSLYVNADSSYQSETAWSLGSDWWDSSLGTGGGTSLYEPEPAYQLSVQHTGLRTNPDVSFVADPATGAMVYDSYNYGTSSPWQEYGGTSLATPCWAGLIAIANEGRVLAGGTTFNSSTNSTQALSAIYSLPSSDFHDITTGTNGSYNAGPGYDEVTGLGTPVANRLVPDLASYGIASKLAVTEPSIVTAGSPFSVVVQVENNIGQVSVGFNGNVTLSLVANPGGSTLGGTLTVKAVNGVATFSNLTLNNVGVGYTFKFQTAVGSGTITTTAYPFAVSPAAPVPHTQQVTAPLSPTDGAGNTLTFSAQVAGYSLLFAVEQQYALAAPPGSGNYYFNYRNQQEKYLISTNGSNAANDGWYVLMPDGSLYAWTGWSMSATLSAAAVASLGTAAYADPTQLFNAPAPYNPTAFSTEQSYDLQAPPGSANYYANYRGAGEVYFISGNGSNSAGGGYYVLLPNGNFYSWANSLTATLSNAPVATLLPFYWQDPGQLVDAMPPSPGLTSVTASISGGKVTVQDTSFAGTVTVLLTAANGVESFVVNFADSAPLLAQPGNLSLPHNQQASVSLAATASYGVTPTYTAQVGGYSVLFAVEQQYALAAPPGSSNYYFNYRNQQEKYLVSTNGNNAANDGYYVLMPDGSLYTWTGAMSATLSATAVASLGTAAYADPTQLFNAPAPYNPTAFSIEQTYDLQAPPASASYYANYRGTGEVYFVSGNGSNPTGGGYYVLLPNGNLYAWDGKSLATSVAGIPVATLPSIYNQNPSQLVDPAQPGELTTVTASVTGSTLTVTDTGFAGTVTIWVTASDGVLSATQSFQITFTDAAPTFAQPNSVSPPHNQQASVSLGAIASYGVTPTYTAQVGGYSVLFAVEQQYALAAPPGSSNYSFNYRNQQEKYLVSTNGNNAANDGYYVLMPDGSLYTWTGSMSATLSATAVASLGTAAYADPTQLFNAPAPYNPTAFSIEQTYDLQAPPASASYYANYRGAGEVYFVSGNGSNPAGGGYYVLMPNGNLYAWDGKSLTTTLETTPVASLLTAFWQNPSQLVTAASPGAVSGVTASISGTTLTVTDADGYVGTVTIYVTASDGVLTTTQTFLVSFT